MKMKLSVIIPLYNTQDFIKSCLDGILSQSLSDFEIIIIDDGSTDNSVKIVNEYMKIDNRIKLIQQENSGASVARNKGIEVSLGKYITFVDSDDIVHEQAFEKLTAAADENSSDIVLGKRQWNINNEPVEDKSLNNLFKNNIGKTTFKDFPEVRKVIGVPSKLFLRDFLVDNNLKFPIGMSSEDFVFTYEAYAKAKVISVISDIVYSYRRRTNSNNSITQSRLTEYNIISRFKQMKMTESLCKKYPQLNIEPVREFKTNYNSRLPRHIAEITTINEESKAAFELIKEHISSSFDDIYKCSSNMNKIRYSLIRNNNLNGLTVYNRAIKRKEVTLLNLIKMIVIFRSFRIAKILLNKKSNFVIKSCKPSAWFTAMHYCKILLKVALEALPSSIEQNLL